MRNSILMIFFTLVLFSGCGRFFSPQMKDDIKNQNGKIGEIEKLANSVKAEIGTMQSQNDIQNSKLDRIQQGLANFQTNNSGVQILSGTGGLVLAMSILGILFFTTMHYRGIARVQTKTADLMAQQIVRKQDKDLENEVFKAAMYSETEGVVLNLIKKHRSQFLE